MTIYIDSDYKCYTQPGEGREAAEVEAFEGKCATYIEGFRYVPQGREWTRGDGQIFRGAMIAPWKSSELLDLAQAIYEETMAAISAGTGV